MGDNDTTGRTFAGIFPGQGSQSVGMLDALATAFPLVTEIFDQASDVLGYDLWRRVQEGPEAELNRTECTQPAMLTAGIACWRAWQTVTSALPAVVAGHSLGEYTALVVAGALGFEDALALVVERARSMQAAVPEGEGAMAALLGLDDAVVMEVCASVSGAGQVAPANFNAPGQVVIAGHAGAVQKAVEAAKAAGARRAVTLPVSVPSHCVLMEGAAHTLAGRLARVAFESPDIPVVHNVDAARHHQPVRWVESVRAMVADGVKVFVEFGPGKVLTGLVRRIDPAVQTFGVYDRPTLNAALEAIHGA